MRWLFARKSRTMKRMPKSWFEVWIKAICKARHSYLDPKDIDAWTFCFEWVIELKRAYEAH